MGGYKASLVPRLSPRLGTRLVLYTVLDCNDIQSR